jgi:hypothetical protein
MGQTVAIPARAGLLVASGWVEINQHNRPTNWVVA